MDPPDCNYRAQEYCARHRRDLGEAIMKKSIAAAVLLAAATVPASAADKLCYTPQETEAAHAIVLQSNLTVLSLACNQDVMYGEFKVRNKTALISYQNDMIDHFRRVGGGERGFESWFTHVTNEAAIQHAGLPSAALCVQTVEQLKYDPAGLKNYLAAHAADVVDGGNCGRPRVKVAHTKAATHQ